MPVYLQTIIVFPDDAGAFFPACASADGAAAMAADVTAADSINLRRENFIDHSKKTSTSMVTKRKSASPRPFIPCPMVSIQPSSPPYSDRSGSVTAPPHFPRGRTQHHR